MLEILAISPHPDDVELCCGGLIVKMAGEGRLTGIVDLTRGELGTEGTAETRTQEAVKAAEILGVQIRENMDFGDCKLDSSFEKVTKLADLIRQYRPSILIAPYGDEQHPDHAASRHLTDKAFFLANLKKVQTDHKAHEVKMVAYYMLHKPFAPSFVVDVTKIYDKKLDAIEAYKSQMKLMCGPQGLMREIRLRDEFYGSQIGVKQAEPFFCKTPLKIDDPVAFIR